MRDRPAGWVASVVALSALLAAGSARADEGNYQPYPLGERALGMGGAFTAMVGDPVLAYYNPAGLAYGRTSVLSASLSVYGIFRRDVEDGGFFGVFEPEPDAEGNLHPRLVDLNYREFPPTTIPTTVILVRRVGPRFRDRSPRQTFAWSVLIPRASDLSYSFRDQADFDDDPTTPPDEHRFSLRESDKLILMGPSYAFRITPTLSVGLSVFGAIRSLSHSSLHTFFNTDRDSEISGVSVYELDLDSTIYSGLVRAGVHWEPARGWRLGLMLSSPSFQVYSEGSYAHRRLDSFTDEYEFVEHDSTEPNDALPFELRVGVAREVPGSFAMALDVSVYGPSSYQRVDPGIGYRGDYFVSSVEREAMANVAVGAEMVLARHWPVRLGFFTDLSAVPYLEPSDQVTLPHIDRVGGTLSVGYRHRNFDINVGVLATIGAGYAHTQGRVGDPDLPTFVPTTARDQRFYFFITGAQRAVGRLLGRYIDL